MASLTSRLALLERQVRPHGSLDAAVAEVAAAWELDPDRITALLPLQHPGPEAWQGWYTARRREQARALAEEIAWVQTAGITAPIVEIQIGFVAAALPTDDAEQAAEDAALLAAWSVVNPDGLLNAPARAADDHARERLEEAVFERWERRQPLVHAQSCFYEVLVAAALTLGYPPDVSRVADAD